MEGLSCVPLPLPLWLLGDVEGWGLQELNVGGHGLLHHLLEGLLLPLYLVGHGLHGSDPSPGDLFGRLLAPAGVIAHFLFFLGRLSTSCTIDIPFVETSKPWTGERALSLTPP